MEPLSEQDLLYTIVEFVQNLGLISEDENVTELLQNNRLTENQYIIICAVYAYLASQYENERYTIEQGIDLNTATGNALDNLGNLLNVPRIQAQPAVLMLTVTPNISTSEAILIPTGTKVEFESFTNTSDFLTTQDYTIPENSTTPITVRCESYDQVYMPRVPAGCAVGLEGFTELVVTNPESSTHGQSIEDDKDYRTRLSRWAAQPERGSKERIQNYLRNLSIVNDFELIPRYAGPGTLKIVCDTIPGEETNIGLLVDENCMIETDDPCTVVPPAIDPYEELVVHVQVAESSNISTEELKTMLTTQLQIYVEGGTTRLNTSIKGLGVGGDFVPADCIRFILEQFLEVENVYFEARQEENDELSPVYTSISVDRLHRLRFNKITVEIV